MFTLSQFPLPYASDALAPYISSDTIFYHHGKHVGTYIKNLNDLIAGTAYADMPLVDIIKTSINRDPKVFNNAAQVYNHDFFFHCLRPAKEEMQMPAELAAAFGGADALKEQFRTAALSVFGSGWTWIVRDGDAYKIITTANADTPIAHGLTPVFTLDVWEHAYYLDVQNLRAKYVENFWKIVNWNAVEQRWKKAV